jgi:hypothetical protein
MERNFDNQRYQLNDSKKKEFFLVNLEKIISRIGTRFVGQDSDSIEYINQRKIGAVQGSLTVPSAHNTIQMNH